MSANVPSIFECINQKADAIKAAKWAAYQPMTRQQLRDSTPRPEPDDNPETIMLDVGVFGQFVVIARPTEGAALHQDRHQDKRVLRRPTTDLRWCIFCKERHAPSAFIHSAKYLHHLSYACKVSLQEARRRPWKHLNAVA